VHFVRAPAERNADDATTGTVTDALRQEGREGPEGRKKLSAQPVLSRLQPSCHYCPFLPFGAFPPPCAVMINRMKFTASVLALTGMLALGAFSARDTVAAQQPKSQWDGVYTEAQAKRGEGFYSQYCASCHGPDLAGGEMAPGLTGGEFASNWNDLSL